MIVCLITVFGGLEVVSGCLFGIVLLIGIVVGLVALAIYLTKKRDEREKQKTELKTLTEKAVSVANGDAH